MTTNRDWLFSLPLDEQIAWMNAPHFPQGLSLNVDRLQNESITELETKVDELQAQLSKCNKERDLFRSKLGTCADLAEQVRNVAMGL